MPSWWSALMLEMPSRVSERSRFVPATARSGWLMDAFVPWIATFGPFAIRETKVSTTSSSSSAGTARLISPICAARVASISSPV